MITGMTMKIAVSLPDDLVEAARRAVARGEAASVSAYVADALAAHQARLTLSDLLDELELEHGPIPAGAVEWARSVADRADALETGLRAERT